MRTCTCNLIASLVVILTFAMTPARAEEMAQKYIIAAGSAMMDAQIKEFEKSKDKQPHADWESGVLWAGIADFAAVSGKSEYFDLILKHGEALEWKPIVQYPEVAKRLTIYWHNADDLCIAQGWLPAYAKTKNPDILVHIVQRFDAATDYINMDADNMRKEDKIIGDMRLWSWCDALFMMPPANAQLSALTGDPKYVQAMHTEWWKASGVMYDEEEHLFFRDPHKIFPLKKTANGKKVFWSRGVGWVLAGLARILEWLPEEDPVRPRYVQQLQEIAGRLAELQQPDGTWSPSLLDYEEFPYSDSSGTALNCFAMAWGINNGVLDEKKFRPVVEKAWAALLAARRDDGLLGYVQAVAHGPADTVYADGNRVYGTGAFLMAASQLAKMAPIQVPTIPPLKANVRKN